MALNPIGPKIESQELNDNFSQIEQRLNNIALYVTDFGAKCDGVTDDTAAFVAAIAKIPANTFGVILVPPGTYKCSPFVLPKYVTLKGMCEAMWGITFLSQTHYPLVAGVDYPINQCLFLVTDTVNPFITVNTGCTIEGISFLYPNQVAPTAASPTVYPATIKGFSPCVDVTIKHCMFWNSYTAIDLDGSDRHNIEWVFGDPLFRGILINRCHDASRISNIHWHDFAYAWNSNVGTWKLANCVGIMILRSDEQMINNTFMWRRWMGIYLDRDPVEEGSFGVGSNLTFDSCTYSIVAGATNNQQSGWNFTNCQFSGFGLLVQSSYLVKLSITNSRFWGTTQRVLDCSNTNANSMVEIIGCHIAFGYTVPPIHTTAGCAAKIYLYNLVMEDNSSPIGLLDITTSVTEFQMLGGRIGNNTLVTPAGMPKIKIDNVFGYNPKGLLTAPAVPATGVALVNPFPHRVMVFVPTITAIGKNGSTIAGMATGTIILDPGESITPTYGSAFNWTWYGL
jgi:hypothetical protein